MILLFNGVKLFFRFTLGSGSVVNNQQAKASVIRSFMNAGSPLEGFNSTEDRRFIQRDKLRTFHRNIFIPVLQGIALKGKVVSPVTRILTYSWVSANFLRRAWLG